MKNKYYTPNLNEFFVGFEYEVKVPEAKCWSKEIFHMNNSHIELIQYVDIQDEFTHNPIRVKYLDKEDIESLEWKTVNESAFDIICEKIIDEYGKYQLIYTYDTNLLQIEIITKKDFVVRFLGIIKNISEFKKLLKQINVI